MTFNCFNVMKMTSIECSIFCYEWKFLQYIYLIYAILKNLAIMTESPNDRWEIVPSFKEVVGGEQMLLRIQRKEFDFFIPIQFFYLTWWLFKTQMHMYTSTTDADVASDAFCHVPIIPAHFLRDKSGWKHCREIGSFRPNSRFGSVLLWNYDLLYLMA